MLMPRHGHAFAVLCRCIRCFSYFKEAFPVEREWRHKTRTSSGQVSFPNSQMGKNPSHTGRALQSHRIGFPLVGTDMPDRKDGTIERTQGMEWEILWDLTDR